MDVANAEPPVHALIDTGALITGMDNEEVAHFLLDRLPASMEGVVYLDRHDRQMILLRGSRRSALLAQCGISPARRFTFFDQIHTTGLDIKQAPSARAVVTIGKDMTFRDYAQGTYRMRGIGKGQTITLFLTPEVQNRIQQELPDASGRPEVDVPAWLLVNSMRMESLQFVQLSVQEIHNVWRKRALESLSDEVRENAANQGDSVRMRRFADEGEQTGWLRQCVNQFREPIGFPVADIVPVPQPFGGRLRQLVEENASFMVEEREQIRVGVVLESVEAVSAQVEVTEGSQALEQEVVHEQEAEEEQEEEAEEEEQKVSAFTRDDEEQQPWTASQLASEPRCILGGEESFYRLAEFRVRNEQPQLAFPANLLLTDNFFRPRWCGMGDRRLKNVSLLLEWVPSAGAALLGRDTALLEKQLAVGCGAGCSASCCAGNNSFIKLTGDTAKAEAKRLALSGVGSGALCPRIVFKDLLTRLHRQLTAGCGNVPCQHPRCASNPAVAGLPPNDAVKAAMVMLKHGVFSDEVLASICPKLLPQPTGDAAPRYVSVVTLAEGETLRRMLHSGQRVAAFAGLALRTADGAILDSSRLFQPHSGPGVGVDGAVQCLRFFNCDFYFTDTEIDLLLEGLKESSVPDRVGFFSECLRLRRRERNLWGDTPLAKVLTEPESWHLLGAKAKLEQVTRAISSAMCGRRAEPIAAFHAHDGDHDGFLTFAEVQRALDSLRLGFSPLDIAEVARLADQDADGKVGLQEYCVAFDLQAASDKVAAMMAAEEQNKPPEVQKWQCQNCTFINDIRQTTCTMCELGWSGRRECPKGKWMCGVESGGCSFFNPNSQFYCEMCNRARQDLASVRF